MCAVTSLVNRPTHDHLGLSRREGCHVTCFVWVPLLRFGDQRGCYGRGLCVCGGVAQGVQTAWRGELQLRAFTADTDRE